MATANPSPGPPPSDEVMSARAKARGVPFFPAAELRVVERRGKRPWGGEDGGGRARGGKDAAALKQSAAPGAPPWATNASVFLSLAAYTSRAGGRIRGCSKGDLWILGSDPSLHGELRAQDTMPGAGRGAASPAPSQRWTCLALAEWHGPVPDGALKLSPLGRWPSRARGAKSARIAALRGPDIGTELSALAALEAARKAWLSGNAGLCGRLSRPTTSNVDKIRPALPPYASPGHRALLKALAHPSSVAPPLRGDPLAGAGLMLDPEAAAAAGATRLNPEQFRALVHVASWASFVQDLAVDASSGTSGAATPLPSEQLRVCLVHGPFGTGKSSVLVSMARYVSSCRDLGPARAGGLQNARVLIASATNVAVDRILLELLGDDTRDELEEEDMEGEMEEEVEEQTEERRDDGSEDDGSTGSASGDDCAGQTDGKGRSPPENIDARGPAQGENSPVWEKGRPVLRDDLKSQGFSPKPSECDDADGRGRGAQNPPASRPRRNASSRRSKAARHTALGPGVAVPVLRVGALRRMHHRLLAHSLHVGETGSGGGSAGRGTNRGGRGSKGASSRVLADTLADVEAKADAGGSRATPRNAAVEDLRALLRECVPGSPEALAAAAELGRVRAGVERERRRRLATAPVVGATCHAILSGGLRGERFDVLVLDEASQMVEPLSAAVAAIAGCRFLVLAGDPAQLPPVIASPEFVFRDAVAGDAGEGGGDPGVDRGVDDASGRGRAGARESPVQAPLPPAYGLARPMFVRLARAGVPTHLLRTQYRCHPAISAAPNAHFYAGRLHDGVTVDDRAPLVEGLGPVLVVDVRLRRGGHPSVQGPAAGRAGAPNPLEAEVVAKLCQTFVGAGVAPTDIGVIATYRAQVAQVNAALELAKARKRARRELLGERAQSTADAAAQCNSKDGGGAISERGERDGPPASNASSARSDRWSGRASQKSIKVATVDSFQGAERDVVILTTSTNVSTSFLAAPERLNVALTRARRHLVIVGCVPALEAASPALRDVVRTAKRTPGAYVPPGGRILPALDALS